MTFYAVLATIFCSASLVHAQPAQGRGVFYGGPAGGSGKSQSVIDHGAVPDGVMRTTGYMTAGSPILSDPNGVFSQSTDLGKWIEVIGSGPGGEKFNACSMTSGSNVVSCSDGTFAKSDQGRYMVVTGAGPSGRNLNAQVTNYISRTQVKVSNLSGLQMVPASAATAVRSAVVYLGFMTLDTKILSVQSMTEITLQAKAEGTIDDATYAYGTDNHAAFQKCLDDVGASGGGTCHVPAVATCAPGATCGYVVNTTNQQAAYVPNAMAIRYDNVSLTGDSGQSNLFCHGAWSVYAGSSYHPQSPYVIRGNCLNIGDENGPRGSAGLSTANTAVSHLHFYGMTNGNTYNALYHGDAAPLTTTGDGWDTTHKGIYLSNRRGLHSGVLVEDVTLQDFKGEELYEGGVGMADMTVRDSTFQNSNGDGLSVSAGTLTVTNNRFINLCNAGVENGIDGTAGHADVLVKHVYKDNLFRLVERAALGLAGVADSQPVSGQIEIADNTFDTIGEVFFDSNPNAGPLAAIYLAPQGRDPYPPGNVTIIGNVFHDVNHAIQSRLATLRPYKNLRVENNKWEVDRYPAASFLTLPFPVDQLLVQHNTGTFSPEAVKNGVKISRVYTINSGNPANTLTLNGVVFRDNTWNLGTGTAYYLFATKAGAGWAALASQNVTWINDTCPGCVGSSPNDGLIGIAAGETIEPYGPIVWLTGGAGDATMTIDASKEEDQTELEVVNKSAHTVTFVPNSNIDSAQSLVVPSSGTIHFKYSAQLRKWAAMAPTGRPR